MRELLQNLLCRLGLHDYELEYRSAPGVFTVDGKNHMIEGKVERCRRCPSFFFSYKDWPRVECVETSQARPMTSPGKVREARAFALA